MTECNAIIVVDKLGHRYGQDEVVERVSFSVNPGEIVGILGASGSGKTTVLRAIAGFVTPTVGSIQVDGTPVVQAGQERIAAERRRIGLMFQDFALFPHMSVAENIEYGIHLDPDRQSRVQKLLNFVGLDGFGHRLPNSLSGGQKQRVALARAIAPKPVALLLDEPFANLDARMRLELGETMRQTLRAESIGAVLVTHDRREAFALSDRLICLGSPDVDGVATILQSGPPEQVFNEPQSRQVAELTGAVFSLSGIGDGDVVSTAIGPLSLRRPSHGPVTVLIRNEQCQFEPDPDGSIEVIDCQFVGPGFKVKISANFGSYWIPSTGAFAAGQRGRLMIAGAVSALA
ncbi:MAG: hypothetical protein CMH52_05130 [Myxococcales bacterium]|nr:hypothetical protein [Myxococcales bacterium]